MVQIGGREGEKVLLRFARHGIGSNTFRVIVPDSREPAERRSRFAILLRNTLLASAAIFAVLQFWRPCFFLTDDNLDGGFPFFCELGTRLWHGQSPFISTHIFGGDYNLLRDPCFFAWHPLYVLTSLLAVTPLRCCITDIDAFVFLMLATSGFVVLADYLRREMPLRIGDDWIAFYALSYTYSMIAVTTGASWLDFLGNHSALPWLVLGILRRERFWGVGLVMLFTLHQALGGHLAPTVSSSIFLSLFALGMSVSRGSWQPLVNWLGRLCAGRAGDAASADSDDRRLHDERARAGHHAGGHAELQHPGVAISDLASAGHGALDHPRLDPPGHDLRHGDGQLRGGVVLPAGDGFVGEVERAAGGDAGPCWPLSRCWSAARSGSRKP